MGREESNVKEVDGSKSGHGERAATTASSTTEAAAAMEEEYLRDKGDSSVDPRAGGLTLTEGGGDPTMSASNGEAEGRASVFACSEQQQAKDIQAKRVPAGHASLPHPGGSITMASTPQAILHTMEEKESFLEQINPMPMPTPTPHPISMPGAYHQSRRNLMVPVNERNELEEESFRRESIQDGSSRPSDPEVSVRGLPIATELAEEHDATLLHQLEAQLRREYEEKIQQEYIRKSNVEVVAEATPSGMENGVFSIDVVDAESIATLRNDDEGGSVPKRRKVLLVSVLLLLLAAIVATLVGHAIVPHENKDVEGSAVENVTRTVELKPVLQAVRERGVLRCHATSIEVDRGEGFTLDLCKALAAAIFSDTSKFEHPAVPWSEHFGAINQGEVDVSASYVSLNMGRDVREKTTHTGLTFSTPYFYTGTGMAGVPNFLKCAEAAETFQEECRDLLVCLLTGTVTQELIEDYLPGSNLLFVESDTELFQTFAARKCNVMAGDAHWLHEKFARDAGYEGLFANGDLFLSHEHLAFASRESDPEWADFCNWILRALITAEALNITQVNAQAIGTTDLFGPEYQNMFINAIAAVGNYGQIYERHFGNRRSGALYNQLNTGATGLIVSNPHGVLLVEEAKLTIGDLPGPVPNGTMEAVINRGQLLCGVIPEDPKGNPRSGFADFNWTTRTWSGMDVDFCKGLAASVSAGGDIETVFFNLSDPEIRFRSLANNTVDVLAGERLSMITDVREPTTGQGFSFSFPYFFWNATSDVEGGALSLVTRQNDRQWSDLVQWIPQFTIHAEEEGIVQAEASKLTVVELFGVKYKQMIRDTIDSIGNYGEIYQRNLEHLIPRAGRNLLNVNDTPMFYPIIPFHPTAR